MAQESVKLNIPLLNGGNFVFWKTKLKAVLVRDELWDVVKTRKPEPVLDTWEKKNNRAMAYITLSVEDNQLIHFQHTEEAYEAWQSLLKKYERSTFGSRLYLRRKLYGIHYKGGSMSEHIDAIMSVVGLLRGSGKPLEDEEIVAVLLVSLPEAYSGLVTALEGRDERDLTVEYVTGKILDEYQRRTEASGASESNGGNSEVALKSAGNPSRINRGRNKNSFNKGTKSEKGGKGQRETRTCYYCHKPGHLKSECRWYKKVQDQEKSESANSTVAANTQSDKSQVAFEAKCGIESFGGWCVDSGATSHMTNQAKFFFEHAQYKQPSLSSERIVGNGHGNRKRIFTMQTARKNTENTAARRSLRSPIR